MGKKIVLTEQQVYKLLESMEMDEMGRAKLACTYANFHQVSDYLRGKSSRKIGYETYIEKLSNFEVGIKYHRTHIVKMDVTDVMTISSGGWDTPTTKDRLNQFLSCRGVHIYQKKFEWFIVGTNDTLPFVDGMQVFPNGHVAAPAKG